MLNLDKIENLIKKEEYETVKKISYNLMRINKDDLYDRFNLACMLSKYPKTIKLSKILLYSLINSKFSDFAITKLTSIYMDEGNFEEIKQLIDYKFIGKHNCQELILLSKIEKNLENYDKAHYYLEEISNMDDYDDLVLVYESILLEMKIGNFEEAFKILNENECMKYHDKYNFIYMYLSYKINGIVEKSNNLYYKRQLTHYNEGIAKKFISHIKYIGDIKFIKSVNINKLYSECKECIQDIKPAYSDYFDRYIVELEYNVGVSDNEKTKYVCVSTFLNEKDIIAINPTKMHLQNQNLGSIKKEEKNVLKYKRETQIEKFNRKYLMEN